MDAGRIVTEIFINRQCGFDRVMDQKIKDAHELRQPKGGKRMKKKIASLIAVLLLTTAGAASAEQRAGALTLSPFVGGYTFDGTEHLQTRPVYGLRLGYDITKNIGVELSGEYGATKTSNNNPFVGNVNMYNARLEVFYNFMADSKFVPFVGVGGGYSHGNNDKNGIPVKQGGNNLNNNDATAQLALGFKYFLAEDIALRTDVRGIMSFHATPAFQISKNDYWANYEYTLGLQFMFGGKKPVVAKVVEPPPPPAPAPAPKPVPPPPPAPVDGKVGAWSDWSACSVPCGGGTQTRTRPVITQPANGGAVLPALSESRSCNPQVCMEEEKVNLLIEFDFNKAVVKKDFYPNVDAIGAFLKKNEKVTITLDGWTDKIGSDKYNKKLSQKRADAVKKYLVDKFKIDQARITAVGHGKSFKYDNKTAEGRYKNRRVEMNQTVMVEKKK